jgi:hypothetical protein
MTASERKVRALKKRLSKYTSRNPDDVALANGVIESPEFHRVANSAASNSGSLFDLQRSIAWHAMEKRDGTISPEYFRKRQHMVANFHNELECTIRFLTRHADVGGDPDGPDVSDAIVRKLIKEIKTTYEYGPAPPARAPTMGQKYDHRAYVIRSIAEHVPPDTEVRAATIAGLMRFAGYPRVDRRLVTSILKETKRR